MFARQTKYWLMHEGVLQPSQVCTGCTYCTHAWTTDPASEKNTNGYKTCLFYGKSIPGVIQMTKYLHASTLICQCAVFNPHDASRIAFETWTVKLTHGCYNFICKNVKLRVFWWISLLVGVYNHIFLIVEMSVGGVYGYINKNSKSSAFEHVRTCDW